MMVETTKTRLEPSPVARGEARARLLSAAIDAFATHGFEAVGPRHIAEAAGVNHSLVGYHFGSMSELWKEAVASLFDQFRDKLAKRFEGLDNLDVDTRITIAIEDLIAFSRDNPALHQIMTQEGRRMTPRLKWLIDRHLKPLFQMTTDMLRLGQKQGRVRDFDPAQLYYAIIALAATPFSIRAEVKAVTGRDPASEESARDIAAMIRFLVFTDKGGARIVEAQPGKRSVDTRCSSSTIRSAISLPAASRGQRPAMPWSSATA